ncbi:hypothetical protein ABZ759_27995 [Streptomyces sp. NPDC047860]|uniref:MmyB family transcriptional regulator n=1 Tax=Streptomyces sp. NPDC047860 TaxID=3155743 RepID=UPI0033C642EC
MCPGACSSSRDVHDLTHPVVGELTVTQQTFQVPREPHQALVILAAEPGSPSAAPLTALRRACGTGKGGRGVPTTTGTSPARDLGTGA